ncbi:hypothetical protein [Bacillus solitudinis]|nr:hypothetical protein [Bacillus solitudinis]
MRRHDKVFEQIVQAVFNTLRLPFYALSHTEEERFLIVDEKRRM